MSPPLTSVDLLVVGFGMAGASAAMHALETAEAQKEKPTILLVDRFEGGGSTTRSAGIVYFGGGTDLQKAVGIDDDVENLFEYLKVETQGAVSEETLYKFCQTSPLCAAWIRDSFQAKFNLGDDTAKLCPFKTSSSPPQYSIQYSGNETAFPYREKSRPCARGHKAFGPGGSYVGYGNLLFHDMERAVLKCESRGLFVQTLTRVIEVQMENGRAVGATLCSLTNAPFWVRLIHRGLSLYGGLTNPFNYLDTWMLDTMDSLERKYGEMRQVRASRGVVLCCGGFGRNFAMVEKYLPKYLNCMPIGSIADDGEGIFNLGVRDCNAKTGNLDTGCAWKFITPAQAMSKGVLVNEEGIRTCSEDCYGATLARSIIANGTGKGFLVFDEKLAKECMDEVLHGEMLWIQIGYQLLHLYWNRVKCNTIEELAAQTQCGPQLIETIKKYNADCHNKLDTVFNKRADLLSPLENGPFYAMKFQARGTVWSTPYFSLGGLSVNEQSGLVLDKTTDLEIPGLFAAGRNAVGVCSNSYVSGLSLADAVFSGRRAAEFAMTGKYYGRDLPPLRAKL